MKKCIVFLIIIITLQSCGTTVWQLNTDCNISTEELFNKISIILMQENFMIKANDLKLGYLQAETNPSYSAWTGLTEIRYWIFKAQGNKITAQAKVSYFQQNVFGATSGTTEKYYNDDVHKDWTWYWNVRSNLESICGNKIIFTEKKTN